MKKEAYRYLEKSFFPLIILIAFIIFSSSNSEDTIKEEPVAINHEQAEFNKTVKENNFAFNEELIAIK